MWLVRAWLVGTAVSAALAIPTAAAADSTALLRPCETLLQVSGEGQVRVPPDMVEIRTSASAEAESAAQAVAAVGVRLDAMITAIRALGIADMTITTNRVIVNPVESARDDDEDGAARRIDPLRYRSRNTLTITVANADEASNVMAALIEAGAAGLGGPDFGLREPAAARQEAERIALDDARRRAERQAAQLGLRIARVVLVSDRTLTRFEGGAIIVTGSAVRAGVRIEPTDVTVETTVYLDFALVPR